MVKVITFLGNERKELSGSRHNIGFSIADNISGLVWRKKYQDYSTPHLDNYEFAETEIDGEKVYLVKPLAIDPKDREFKTDDDGKFIKDENGQPIPNPSFGFGDINHSGVGLKAFLEDKKREGIEISNSDIAVICDDLSNEQSLKEVTKTSTHSLTSSNHNGIKDIAKFLGRGFIEISIPVGKPRDDESKPEFVLAQFDADKTKDFSTALIQSLPQLVRGEYRSFQENFNQILKEESEKRKAQQDKKTAIENYIDGQTKEIEKLTDCATEEELEKALEELKINKPDYTNLQNLGKLVKPLNDSHFLNNKDKLRNLVFIKISKQRIKECEALRDKGEETEFTKSTFKALKSNPQKEQKKSAKEPKVKDFVLEIAKIKLDLASLKQAREEFLPSVVKSDDEPHLKQLDDLDNNITKMEQLLLSKQRKMVEELSRLFALGEKYLKDFIEKNPSAITFETLAHALTQKEFSIVEILFSKASQDVLNTVDIDGNSLLHLAVKSECGTEIIEYLLDLGLSPDQKNLQEKTPIHLALEQYKRGLPAFYALLAASKTEDPSLIENYHDFAKEYQDKYLFDKKDMVSDLQSGKMLPAKLIKHHYDGRKKDLKIFTPYSDRNWSQFPKQTLEDFGCEFVEAQYSIDDDRYFKDQKGLKELVAIIRNQIAQSNGLVVLGNNGNIDQDFFTADKIINLSSPESRGNRRTFVEAVAYAEALKLGIPIWGICGGTQMAGTLCGGKIIRLEQHQDLKGNEIDTLKLAPGSIADPNQYSSKSKASGVNSYDTKKALTWSAHYQGLDPAKLPENFRIIATSESSPAIPKIYEHFTTDDNGNETHFAFLAQNHIEADLAHNKVHRKLEEAFVDRCAEYREQEPTHRGNTQRQQEYQKCIDFLNKHFIIAPENRVSSAAASSLQAPFQISL